MPNERKQILAIKSLMWRAISEWFAVLSTYGSCILLVYGGTSQRFGLDIPNAAVKLSDADFRDRTTELKWRKRNVVFVAMLWKLLIRILNRILTLYHGLHSYMMWLLWASPASSDLLSLLFRMLQPHGLSKHTQSPRSCPRPVPGGAPSPSRCSLWASRLPQIFVWLVLSQL